METWISRDQRQTHNRRWRLSVITLLLLISLVLVLYKFYPRIFDINRLVAQKSDKSAFKNSGESKAFIIDVLGKLGLEYLPVTDEPLDYFQKPALFPAYKILWPKDYPFVWLTARLQIECRAYENLAYSALEIGDNGRLAVWLIDTYTGDSLAEFLFDSSSKATPRVSSIAFVFDNFADFKQNEALELIWLNVPFGYVLKPDQVPDDKLAKALKSSHGQCILEIPSDTISWEIIMNGHKLTKRLSNNELSPSNLRTVLDIFPVLDAISFKESEMENHELEKMVLSEAANLRLTYLYNRNIPGYADSIAYLSGLKIKRTIENGLSNSLSSNELRLAIIGVANDLTRSDKGIFYVNSTADNLQIIISLLPLLEKMNISITPPLRLAETVENL